MENINKKKSFGEKIIVILKKRKIPYTLLADEIGEHVNTIKNCDERIVLGMDYINKVLGEENDSTKQQ